MLVLQATTTLNRVLLRRPIVVILIVVFLAFLAFLSALLLVATRTRLAALFFLVCTSKADHG
jgi:hypothetical protein